MKFPTFEKGYDLLIGEGYEIRMAGPCGGLVYADGICLHLAALCCDGGLEFSEWPSVRKAQEKLKEVAKSYPR